MNSLAPVSRQRVATARAFLIFGFLLTFCLTSVFGQKNETLTAPKKTTEGTLVQGTHQHAGHDHCQSHDHDHAHVQYSADHGVNHQHQHQHIDQSNLLNEQNLQDIIARIGADAPCDASASPALFTQLTQPFVSDELPDGAAFLQVNESEFTTQLDGFAVAVPRQFCFPLSSTRTVTLTLERFRVLHDDAKVVAADGEAEEIFTPDPAMFLEGTVNDIPGSHVYMAVFQRYVSGYIEIPASAGTAKQRFVIAPLDEPGNQQATIIVYDQALVNNPPPVGGSAGGEFTGCGSEGLDDYYEQSRKSIEEHQAKKKGSKDRAQSSDIMIVDVAVDCDSQYFADHGSNLSRSVNYVRTVMGSVSALYKRDANLRILMPYVRIWRSGDPYNDTDTRQMLFDMRSYWNTNMRDVDRALAHMFTGRNGSGGIAWVNVLCSSKLSGYGYAVSGLRSNYNYPRTSYAWDTDVTAHELGHNLGSSHTHSCSWNPAIDSCYDAEGSCFPNRVSRRGTIMSYCHLTSSGKGLYLHPRVASLIRSRVENASCTYREEKSAAKDLAVMSIALPEPGAAMLDSTDFIPKLVVKNIGTEDQTNVDVTFLIEEFDGTDVWSSTATIDLDAGETRHVSFASTSLVSIEDYFAQGEITLANDARLSNNKSRHQFSVVGSYSGTLDLTSHNSDTTLVSGSTSKITWTRSGVTNVSIEYSPDDGANWYTIRYTQSASSGEYNWIVPAVNTDDARIRINDRNNANLNDISDDVFSITVRKDIEVREIVNHSFNGTSRPSFVPRVEVRNNGSLDATNVPVTVRVISADLNRDVFSSSATLSLVSANTIDTLDFPEISIPASGQHMIHARAFLPGDTDVTNDSVARASYMVAPTLLVEEPNGAESWQVGSLQNIEWLNSVGTIGGIRLDYSVNSGSSWQKIVRATANDGDYNWRVPNAPGSDVRVRAADNKHAFVLDISDADFTIVPIPKPTNISVSSDVSGVKVEWDDGGVVDLAGYRIYRGTSPGSLSQIAQVSASTRSYEHNFLTVGQKYYYDVRALAGPFESEPATPIEYCRFAPVLLAEGPLSFCSGGSVVLDAGANHTSYLWSNGATTRKITVTQGGSYSASITTSSGCQGTTPDVVVTISPAPDPTITANGPTEFCVGEDVTLDVGLTFSSVLWSNGSTNNAITVTTAGLYTATVSNANGCSASTSVSVSVFTTPSPVIAADGPTEFCAGDDVTLDVGNSFAQVLWSNGATSNAITVNLTDTYTVTVTTASGCSASTSISVTVNPPPTPTIVADGPTEFCAGGDVTLDVGNTFAQVLWSNNATTNAITVNQSGTYSATVIDANGCSASTSVTVTVNPLPTPTIVADGPTEFCVGEDVTLDVGLTFSSVLWSNGSTNNAITVTTAGLYTATVSNANGCSASTSVSVSVFTTPSPVIAADGPTEFCAGDDVTLDVGNSFAQVLWSNGATTNAITVNLTETYTVTVTTASGCSASTSISVTVNPLPNPTIVADGPTEFCAGEDVTLDVGNSFTQVLWSNNATTNAITVNQSGTFSATVIDANGCSASTSVTVTVNNLPTPTITANGPTEFCVGEDVTLDVGLTFSSVLWSNGSTNNAITVTTAGLYTATVSNANGCSASTSVSVSVFTTPSPVIAADGPTEFCAGDDVTLDVGNSFAQILWSNGATSNAITVNLTDTYTVTVTTASGCSASTSIAVTVNNLPTPTITADGPTEFCAGEDVTLDVGNSFTQVLWSNNATTNAITVNQSGTFSATVIDANGCSASTSVTVTVNPLPNPAITANGPTEFCVGEDVTLDVGLTFSSVLWSNGSTNNAITVTTAGLYTATVSNANGCSASTSVSVSVFTTPSPVIAADGPTEFCAGDDVTLDVGNSFAQVLWSNGATTNAITVNLTDTYTVTVTTASGCSASTSISVTVNPLPDPTITADGPTEFCAGDDVTLDVGNAFTQVLWSNNATTNAITVNQSGTFSATVIDANGCSASTSVTVTVNPLPTPTIVADGPTEFCAGDDVTLDVGNTFAQVLWSNNATTNAVTVNQSGTFSATVVDANGCSASTSVTVTVNPLPTPTIVADGPTEFCAGGDVTLDVGNTFAQVLWSNGATTNAISVNLTDTYSVIVTSASGCSASTSISVTVNPLPNPTIVADGPTEFCAGDDVTLDVGNSFAQVLWSNGATTNAITVNLTDTYSVIVTSASGCSASTSISVTVNPLPNPTIVADGPTDFCAGGDVTLDVGNSFTQVLWSNNATTNEITVNQSGTYSATVIDANGCSASTSISVTVNNLPTPTIVADGPTDFCLGEDVTLDVGLTFSSVLWSNNATTNAITVNQSGTYSATVIDANGCSASTSVTVTVNNLPTPTITANGPTEFCLGEDVTLDVGLTFSSVLWSNGSTNNAITVTTAGLYTATVSNANGCSASTSVSVSVFTTPSPVIAADGPTEFCAGDDVTLDVGNSFAQVLWSNGATTNAITVNLTDTYSVIVTSASGCSASTSISVTVNPLPNPTIVADGPTEFCAGDDVTLDVGLTFSSVLWSNNATTNAITVNQSGTYSATVIDANGCSASTSVTVTVNALPTPTIVADGPTDFCLGEDVTLDVGLTFSSVLWSNGSTNNAITVTTAGLYTATVSNANGCSASTSISVTVFTSSSLTIATDGPSEFCAGDDVTLDVGPNFAQVLWSNGATSNSITVSQTGIYSVTVTSAGGCSASSSLSITVNPLPTPTVSANGLTEFCAGNDVTLDVGSTYSSVLWTNGATTNAITVNQSGTYSATVVDANGCSASTSISVTVHPLPNPTISANGPTTICDGGDVTLSVTGSYASVLWSNGSTQSSITVSNTGMYTVTATTIHGCEQSSSITVSTGALASISISADGPLEFCGTGNVELDAGPGYNSYLWSNGASTQTIVVSASGVYQVTVASLAGCETSAQVQVTANALRLQIGLLLQGPFTGSEMHTDLLDQGYLPDEQPFDVRPFRYDGDEEIEFTATDITDWVLVELRDRRIRRRVILRQAALLDRNGVVRDMDGSVGIELPADFDRDSFFVVVHSQGHLSLMSANVVEVEDCAAEIDLRKKNAAKRRFQRPTVKVAPGKFATYGGDASMNGFINSWDRVLIRRRLSQTGYSPIDVNRDGIINAADRRLARSNRFRFTQVP